MTDEGTTSSSWPWLQRSFTHSFEQLSTSFRGSQDEEVSVGQPEGENSGEWGSTLIQRVRDGMKNAGEGLGALGRNVSTGASKAATDIESGLKDGVASLQNLSPRKLGLFASLMAASTFFFFLALFVGLPVLVLKPTKFALCITLSNLCLIVAVGVLRGAEGQMKHMLAAERLPFSVILLGSILLTLWASMVVRSYILSLFFSLGQVCAVLYYMASYFPGGAQGMRVLLGMTLQVAQPLMKAFGKGVFSVASAIFKC